MQSLSVVFTRTFEVDIQKVIEYLIENDFDTDIVPEIRRKTERLLSDSPEIGVMYDDDRQIRRITILSKNSVYYQVVGNVINVLHIRAGRMSKEI